MNWLLTGILCVLVVELALRLPFSAVLGSLRRSGHRAVLVVLAQGVSDHWKEKALVAYARATFLSSIRLAGLLLALLGAAAACVVLLEQALPNFRSFLLGWRGIGFSLFLAGLYLQLRRPFPNGHL